MAKEVNGWKIFLKKIKEEGFQEGYNKGQSLFKQEIESIKLMEEETKLMRKDDKLKTGDVTKKAIIGFIQYTDFKDAQIADILEQPIAFVETIRKELKELAQKTKEGLPPQ